MYNLLGFTAILIWSVSVLLILALSSIPIFQLTAIALGISGGLTSLKLTVEGKWHLIKLPKRLWFWGILGIGGNNLTYYLALRYAPPAHVEMISWTWPLVISLCSITIFKQPLILFSSVIGFFGIFLLKYDYHNHFQNSFIQGYVYAALDVILWCVYTLTCVKYKRLPYELPGLYNGIAALLAFICHLQFETWSQPSTVQWLLILGLGLGPLTLSHYFWDLGIKYGNFNLLNRLAYLLPLLSTLFLSISQYVILTPQLMISALMIMSASVLPYLVKKLFPQEIKKLSIQ